HRAHTPSGDPRAASRPRLIQPVGNAASGLKDLVGQAVAIDIEQHELLVGRRAAEADFASERILFAWKRGVEADVDVAAGPALARAAERARLSAGQQRLRGP